MNNNKNSQYKVKVFDIWALGITIVIGGQYFGWNFGLSSGFGSMAIATCLMGTAYVGLILSVSEISSALPFAGGAYGLARCSVGFYPGFLVGCFEAMEYIVYVATSAVSLGLMIGDLLELSTSYQPLIWFLFYVSALAIQLPGGRVFWYSSNIMAVVSTIILLMYCFGSCKYINYDNYTPYVVVDDTLNTTTNKGMFVGGIYEFIKIFPLAAWFYVGVESLPFAADKVHDPKYTIPMGSITCVLTLFATSLLVYFITCGIPPGVEETSTVLTVFNSGFGKMFGISDKQALILSIPATYATAFGFIFPYGRLLESLSNSKLLPKILSTTTQGESKESATSNKKGHSQHSDLPTSESDDSKVDKSDDDIKDIDVKSTPYVAVFIGSVLGYAICLMQYFYPFIGLQLFNICILSAFVAYITQCIGYIVLQTKFQTIKREFRSPFGVYGAMYSATVFSFGFVSVVYFQPDNHFAIYVFLCISCLLTCYYYLYANKRQTFSKQEQKILFVAHVITYNGSKSRQRARRPTNTNASKPMQSKHFSKGSSAGSVKASTRLFNNRIIPVNKLSNHKEDDLYISSASNN